MAEALSPTTRLAAELFAPVTAETAGTKATMRIFGRIDPDGEPWGVSANDVQAALDALPEDVTDLEVQIQTRGGDAFEGVAIMNMIRSLPINTEAVVVGLAASAGSYIVQGANKVTMMPHSQLMIHRGSVLAIGQAPDMRMAADRLESLDKTMANIYTEKAGGTADEWLAAMTPETWYTADEAVTAGLADGVRKMPKPADAKASLDLSIFAYAGRDNAPEPFIPTAPKTPAEPPVPPPNNKEADTMSDTLIQGLRERFGLPEDADEATVLAKADEVLDQATAPKAPADDPDAVDVDAALAKSGKVAVSQAYLDTLKEGSEAGKAALARQQREDRDAAIAKAQAEGKIGRADDTVKAWQAAWDRDPASTAKEIEALGVRFPVGSLQGRQGHDETADASVAFSDDEAAQLGALAGVSKEALTS